MLKQAIPAFYHMLYFITLSQLALFFLAYWLHVEISAGVEIVTYTFEFERAAVVARRGGICRR